MQVLIAILTLALMYPYVLFVQSMVRGHHYFVLLLCLLATFAIGRWMSTDWEKEQDDRDLAAWRHKWRCRFSRLRPARGEILPPENVKLPKSESLRQ